MADLVDEPDDIDFAAGQAELDDLVAQAAAYAQADDVTTTDLVAHASAEDRRALLIERRTEVERIRQDVAQRADALERQMKTQIEQMRSKIRKAQQALEPLRQQAKELGEGISMIEGYLGIGEGIERLREGEPAAADETVWVRQLVLGWDEEVAVTTDGGLDHSNRDEFIDWLLADDAHVTQIAPEAKCVVAVRPRANPKDYGDDLPLGVLLALADADRQTFLLIRNGGNLYLHTPRDFDAGKLLVPDPAEFESLYTVERRDWDTGRVERVQLQPGTHAWDEAERAADARRRYYMRGALVLEGLLHRTAVFHPVPADASFVRTESYDAGHTGVILDGVRALGSGLESWPEYQKRLTADLRVGMRVLIAPGRREEGEVEVYPPDARGFDSNAVHMIEDRAPGDTPFTVRFTRTDMRYGYEFVEDGQSWGRWGEWPYKKRASVTVHPAGFDRVVPLDLMDPADVDRFLTSRLERRHYLTMFPLLKAARRILADEAAAEAPFRLMLTGHLANTHDVDIATVEADLDDLIAWYKGRRRDYRPLVYRDHGDELAARKGAISEITDEYGRRLTARRKPVNQPLVDRLASIPGTLLVARRRDGKYMHVAPTDGSKVYVTITPHGVRSGPGEAQEWVTIGRRTAQWQILWTAPEFEAWPIHASPKLHPTGPQMAAALAAIRETDLVNPDDNYGAACAVTYSPRSNRFEVWRHSHTRSGRSWEHGEWSVPDSATRCDGFNWQAKPDGGVTVTHDYWDGSHTYSGWGVDHWRDPNKRDRYGEGDAKVVLFESPEAIAEAHAAHDRYLVYKEESSARDAARSVVRAAVLGAAETAWGAAVEERLYAAFVEQYSDPSLWEGHRKSIRTPRCPNGDLWAILHRSKHTSGLPPDTRWAEVAGRLVTDCAAEAGIDIDASWDGIAFGDLPDEPPIAAESDSDR